MAKQREKKKWNNQNVVAFSVIDFKTVRSVHSAATVNSENGLQSFPFCSINTTSTSVSWCLIQLLSDVVWDCRDLKFVIGAIGFHQAKNTPTQRWPAQRPHSLRLIDENWSREEAVWDSLGRLWLRQTFEPEVQNRSCVWVKWCQSVRTLFLYKHPSTSSLGKGFNLVTCEVKIKKYFCLIQVKKSQLRQVVQLFLDAFTLISEPHVPRRHHTSQRPSLTFAPWRWWTKGPQTVSWRKTFNGSLFEDNDCYRSFESKQPQHLTHLRLHHLPRTDD